MGDPQVKIYHLLRPLALCYRACVWMRNWFFDRNLLASQSYPIPVICVGNLAVGGTGKTPFVDYLIRMLGSKYRLAVLSRGYKRKSSGFVQAHATSICDDIGDEACQLALKYPQVIVAVDRNRRRGMQHLLSLPEDVRPQIVLMDDGFQHRYVKSSFSILITDCHRPFHQDRLLPAGRLREPAQSATRAEMIVVSKCPGALSPADSRTLAEAINPAPRQSLFFSGLSYQPIQGVFPNECDPSRPAYIRKEDEILVVTGIANPAPLIEEIKQYTDKVQVLSFGDHHDFNKRDMQKIHTALSAMNSSNPLIICTEKDAARIRHNPNFPPELKPHIYYIPIHIHFLFNGQVQFEQIITRHIHTFISGDDTQKLKTEN